MIHQELVQNVLLGWKINVFLACEVNFTTQLELVPRTLKGPICIFIKKMGPISMQNFFGTNSNFKPPCKD
jgi:hypothetical protein